MLRVDGERSRGRVVPLEAVGRDEDGRGARAVHGRGPDGAAGVAEPEERGAVGGEAAGADGRADQGGAAGTAGLGAALNGAGRIGDVEVLGVEDQVPDPRACGAEGGDGSADAERGGAEEAGGVGDVDLGGVGRDDPIA